MKNKDYQTIGLYEHNIEGCQRVDGAYQQGNQIVGIVHATGTGKTYIGLQLSYENQDQKIVWVCPSIGMIEHYQQVIEGDLNLNMQRDFPNLEFRTYTSFISLSKQEIADIDCDLLIVDEFHHLGAPVWGARINTFIETHPDMRIFGMTAYTVRDRGTIYERDMANPETNEIFSNKIVSRYDLCDAILDGVLPEPIYRTAHSELLNTVSEIETLIYHKGVKNVSQELLKKFYYAKQRVHEAPSMLKILKKNLKPNGKYIYFCPPYSEEGTNDIKTIQKRIVEELRKWIPEEQIETYITTSEMGKEGKKNREAFYLDQTMDGKSAKNKFRIMFAINQYNEGIHAPNVDGVIMGRGTTSDIVYFEQLGRGLSVRGDTVEKRKEYERLSLEELLRLCEEREIKIKGNITKEKIIDKLVAPVIIDLTNNLVFIKELENQLKDRIRERQEKGIGMHRSITLEEVSFDIEVEDEELFEILNELKEKLTITWDKMYEYAKAYYEEHGDLEVPTKFTLESDQGPIRLGQWIASQRLRCSPESDRGQKLLRIGMRFENKISTRTWEEMYEYAKKYYEEHGNLEVPQKYTIKSDQGLIYLGRWIANQRLRCSPESDQGKKLSQIGMRWNTRKKSRISWEEMYEYAKKYYEGHGNLEVPQKYTIESAQGPIRLGLWIMTQRQTCSPESDRGKKLSQIGMRWNTRKKSKLSWEEMYEYAKAYYEKYGNLEVPYKFTIESDQGPIRLGQWIASQRQTCLPESDRGQKLLRIGMRFENKISTCTWEEMYEYAKAYYEEHGDLEVPTKFTIESAQGPIRLGQWIVRQRQTCSPESDRGKKLSQIGMIWNVKKNKEEIQSLCTEYGIDYQINQSVLKRISTQEFCSKVNYLLNQSEMIVNQDGRIHEIFSMSGSEMFEKYGIHLEELILYEINKKI